jgi:hypothetical protein
MAACSPSQEVVINQPNCETNKKVKDIQVFIKSEPRIKCLIYNGDTVKKSKYDPSIELDFNLSVSENEALKLIFENTSIVIDRIDNSYPCLEIKTNIFGQLELNYFCKEKFFD